MKSILIIFLVFLVTASFSQSQTEDEILGGKAMQKLQDKKFQEAIELLDSAYTISGNYDYLYEIAFVHYKRRDFKKVIGVIRSFINKAQPKEHYYQLLASSYDFIGQKDEALRVLKSGLQLLPNSGRIHYELGVTEYGRDNKSEAIAYWDKAIALDPYYVNSYYQLMKETYQSDREIYAMIFAEIFLHFPAENSEKVEASSIIYSVYENALKKNKTLEEPDFTEYVGEYNSESAAEYPFRIAFQQISNNIYQPQENVDIIEITKFRKEFVEEWFSMDFNALFPNPLFEYQKILIDEGLFETYSYLILSSGNTELSKKLLTENREDLMRFFEFQEANPIDLQTFIFNTSVYLSN